MWLTFYFYEAVVIYSVMTPKYGSLTLDSSLNSRRTIYLAYLLHCLT